jgi:hypothetical protein
VGGEADGTPASGLRALFAGVLAARARRDWPAHAVPAGPDQRADDDSAAYAGRLHQNEGFVDDFTVEPPGTWDGAGAALLLAAAERLAASGVRALRVVTAHADQAKCGMLASLSLRVVERWWVRELTPAGPAADPGWVSGPGFAGWLGPAPPVYDPGGPVFQADPSRGDASPDVIEREAAERGAVLAVCPAVPGTGTANELARAGWSVASDWYLGWPLPVQSPRR